MTQETLSQTPGTACCLQVDAATRGSCRICQGAICGNCQDVVNGQALCARCTEKVMEELAAESAADPGALFMGVLGGVVAAILGGAAWLALLAAVNIQSGLMAIFVGWLAGQGVSIASGKKRGLSYQCVAVACCLTGVLFGKLFVLSYLLVRQGSVASYIAPEIFAYFPTYLKVSFSFFDILWIALSIPTAWRAVKPTLVVAGQ